jgi:hypothetical protein
MIKPNVSSYVAIDPLALLLPPRIYQILIEAKYPHVPLVEALKQAQVLSKLTPEERADTLSRVKQVKEYAEAVERVVEKTTR